jgi:hypothetical protein
MFIHALQVGLVACVKWFMNSVLQDIWIGDKVLLLLYLIN